MPWQHQAGVLTQQGGGDRGFLQEGGGSPPPGTNQVQVGGSATALREDLHRDRHWPRAQTHAASILITTHGAIMVASHR